MFLSVGMHYLMKFSVIVSMDSELITVHVRKVETATFGNLVAAATPRGM